jgi:ATP-binding cassette subfamily B protein
MLQCNTTRYRISCRLRLARDPARRFFMSDIKLAKPAEKPKRRIGDLFLIWGFATKYPWRIAAAGLALLIAALATLAIPSGFKLVIDKGFVGSGGADIGRWFIYLIQIVVVLAIATACRFYFVSWLGERVVADVRGAIQANLLRLSPSYFEENRPAEIASRLTADTSVIEQIVGTTVSVALRNTVLGIGGIIYLFTLAPKLTLMLLVGIPVVILPIVFIGRKLQDMSRKSQDRVADVGAMVDEVLGAMKIVQAFGQQNREAGRFSAAVESAFNTARRRIVLRAIMTATVIFLLFGSITLIMWQGALDVQAGKMSGGTIAAFVFTGALVASSFGALTEVYGDLVRGAGAAGRLTELLREQPGIAAPPNPVKLPEPALGLSLIHI